MGEFVNVKYVIRSADDIYKITKAINVLFAVPEVSMYWKPTANRRTPKETRLKMLNCSDR